MLIDWFTVGAQALNFIILVWLLKRFLYKPILKAIDAREQRIAAELADAGQKQIGAQQERELFQRKNEEFDRQRTALLRKATDDAGVERRRLLEDARKAADALSAKRQEELRSDANILKQAIRHRTQEEVFAVARKALADLAATTLEARMCEVFIHRLRTMDGGSKQGLGAAIKTATKPVLVRSAFELPATERDAIQRALNETFSVDVHIRFEAAPDLVSGIELVTDGHKVAWSIAEYLVSIEAHVGALLNEPNRPASRPERPPLKSKVR